MAEIPHPGLAHAETARRHAFAVVEEAIARGPIPGAAAAVGNEHGDAFACYGLLEPGGSTVTPDTWYDLASLTKVLCTTPILLDWIAAGRLDPRAPLREYLPEVAWLQGQPNLGDLSVLELATHTGGLPAWEPLYTLGLARATLLAKVLHTPLSGVRGQIVYSDLGFIILGLLIERLGGRRLDEQAHLLFARLGLEQQLAFRAPDPEQTAPTEQCPWRGRMLRGEVHDENAAALEGVAGHAGLFGTLAGVAGYARALLEGRLHPPAVVEYLAREHGRGADAEAERRGFGWARAFPGWSGGELLSERSIGHSGFTGVGVWLDLSRQRYTVLLTNRVHPTRHADPAGITRLRRAFNQAAHAV